MDNIMDAITKQYTTLTKSGRKLADYLFNHASETQYLSISVLAENSGVSEATITRFCHSLGLAGYNDFKLALAKSDHVTDLGEPTSSIGSDDSLTSMLQKIYTTNVGSLTETLTLLDETALTKAINLLSAARRVYCFGQGGSMVMAMEAWARFSTADSRFIHIEDSHMQAMAAALATSEDVILFFSYSGSTKDMEDILNTAKKRAICIILVTHFPQSRAAQFADAVLLCGYNESPLQSGCIAAKVGQLFIIECLYYGFCKNNPEVYAASRASTAEAIAQKLL